MPYPIPDSPQEISALTKQPVYEELVAAVIAGVVKVVRNHGQSLDQLTTELLADDPMLDRQQRRWLSQLVAQAWEDFP